MGKMTDKTVDEPIEPVEGSFDPTSMTRGEPGLPLRFRWRGRLYVVVEVLRRWKTTGPCRSGSDEQYVRRHWYRLRTTDGKVMDIYFERQPPDPRRRERRWWIHGVSRSAS
jgi:hypothetical protein